MGSGIWFLHVEGVRYPTTSIWWWLPHFNNFACGLFNDKLIILLASEIKGKYPNFVIQASSVMHVGWRYWFYWTLRLLVCLFIIVGFLGFLVNQWKNTLEIPTMTTRTILANLGHDQGLIILDPLTRIMWSVVWQLGFYLSFGLFSPLVRYSD